jgi:hypothetical protein
MRPSSLVARPLAVALAAAMLLLAMAPLAPRQQPGPVMVRAAETTEAVDGSRDFDVSPDATHVAIHWSGHPDAVVTVSFSTDGKVFSEPSTVDTEDSDDGRDVSTGDETYGDLMGVDGVRTVRVHTDRPLAKVTVLALDASGPEPLPLGLGAQAEGATPIPTIISRSQWGADESIRFDPAGDEFWPREFFPLQKLVVHHTAGRNDDPDPAATVRAIYYYHAVTRRWFDIGYNYLIDEAGRIYEGRYARDFWNGEVPSSDDPNGLTVAGGHAKYHNSGTMGIALLGDFSSRPPTAAARASLVRLLAWAAAKYHIDPHGASLYVNPLTGITRTTNNIAGHRDYQATACPGAVLNGLLPAIRNEVAAQMNTWAGAVLNPPRQLYFAAGTYVGHKFSATGATTATKPYTLPRASSAQTNQWATVPGTGANWWYVTNGVWAGYWIQGSSRITVSGTPPTPALESYETARPLTMPAGTRTAYAFNTYGAVTSSKAISFSAPTVVWTVKKSGIPNQGGSWYYITVGAWKGYWILDQPGMSLGAPPPPLPTPIAVYDPPRTLYFAPGTYVGRRFSQYGVPAGTWTATITRASSAPTSRYSTLPGQTGNWYYIVLGIWDTYWIKEGPGITLGAPRS